MITPQRMQDFVIEVRILLALEDEFDRTLAYHVRRKVRQMRYELSVRAGYLAADLAAELPPVEQLATVEGGVA